jgi:hypothetical protein
MSSLYWANGDGLEIGDVARVVIVGRDQGDRGLDIEVDVVWMYARWRNRRALFCSQWIVDCRRSIVDSLLL